MFVFGFGVANQIIEIDHTDLEVQISHCLFHASLECGGGVREAEGHPEAFEEPQVSNGERRIRSGPGRHRNLPKPGYEIQTRKMGHAP